MSKKIIVKSNQYSNTLNVNGLQGHMIFLPSINGAKNNFLLIYDALSSLDEWKPYIDALNKYGSVTCIDLPGFGGMESFYRIGEKPTLDIYADYIAAIIKLRLRRRNITLVGVGYGFVIATRMLQKYPEIVIKTKLVISINGFCRYDDLASTKSKRYLLSPLYYLGTYLLPSLVVKLFVYNQFCLVLRYRFFGYDEFILKLNEANKKTYLEAQKKQLNDTNLRTYLMYKFQILNIDICKKQVNVPLWHVSLQSNNTNVKVTEQHLQVVYRNFHQSKVNIDSRIVAIQNKQVASKLLPSKLRRMLLQIQ
jgi:pimeloyl-ACP methyl ester carboxylesterase